MEANDTQVVDSNRDNGDFSKSWCISLQQVEAEIMSSSLSVVMLQVGQKA